MRITINFSTIANAIARISAAVNQMARAFVSGYLCLEHPCVGFPVGTALQPCFQTTGGAGASDERRIRTLSMVKPLEFLSGRPGLVLGTVLTFSDWRMTRAISLAGIGTGMTGQELGGRQIKASKS